MTPYQGNVRLFVPRRGGSFSIDAESENAGFDSVTMISVSSFRRASPKCRGLTRDGISSRWGEAKRSKTDPACWIGSDFKICVY